MTVELVLGTKSDPGSKVIIQSNIKFTDIAGFDRWLKAQKLARDWLKKELEK